MTPVCLLTLCGLPASGKTTFVKRFTEHVNSISEVRECELACDGCSSYCLAHIDYDDLIPPNLATVSRSTHELSCAKVTEWKSYRTAILQCLGDVLELMRNGTSREMFVDVPVDMKNKFTAVVSQLDRHRPVVIIIDDNMYYSSMRYQMYQLARKYCASYAQLYLPVAVSEALHRNSARTSPVPDDVILTMANRLDVPCTINGWEKQTQVWTSEDSSTGNFHKVISLISEAFNNPLVPSTDDFELQASRVICSTNVIHQADCILRHLLTEYLTSHKGAVADGKILAKHAKCVNGIRQEILQLMRNKQLLVPQLPTDTDSQLDSPTSPLYTFVHSEFLHRLNTAAQSQ